MTGPCLHDSPTISLDLDTDGLSLIANVRNLESSVSATQGDHTIRNVNDHDTLHEQTQTLVISNATGTSPAKGLIVATFDPIWIAPNFTGFEATWLAQLIVGGTVVDERNQTEQQLVLASGLDAWLPCGVCLGQVSIAAGGSVSVTFRKQVINTGSAGSWSFLMGGDKLVASLGY